MAQPILGRGQWPQDGFCGDNRGGGKADRPALQKAFESMTDFDMNGLRINLRPKKYESVRLVDLVTITPEGKVVR